MILIMGLDMKPLIDKYIEDIKDTSIADYQYILKMPYDVGEDNVEKFTLSSLNYDFDSCIFAVSF